MFAGTRFQSDLALSLKSRENQEDNIEFRAGKSAFVRNVQEYQLRYLNKPRLC